jgi:site-specific recombinase XerD
LPASRDGEQLGHDGLREILNRRAHKAGIERSVRPRGTRHYSAHALNEAGATDEDTMTLGGWRDPKIVRRYSA